MTDVFWQLHAGLPRQAPGSDATTRRILAAAALPRGARVLDIGCGPGRASVLLAAEGEAQITAVDVHEPFLEETRLRAESAGVADRVLAQMADMNDLPHPDGSFDALWAEGSAYVMGLPDALQSWRRLLAPGGRVGLTDCVWTTDRPSLATTQFWRAAYPQMRRAEDNVELARRAGYEVLDWWVLPESDWWDEYYGPLSQRLAGLTTSEQADAEGVAREIELWREHGDEYGYAAYVLVLSEAAAPLRPR